MKKLCVLLVLILALSGAAMAETPATPTVDCGGFTYIVLEDGTAQIVDWQGPETALEVPAMLDGLPVTSISECAFADNDTLMSITLPPTVAEIGVEAFSGCVSLGQVNLPEGLLRIGDLAFYGCEGLTQIALPDSVVAVGVNPFKACDNLNDVFVSPDHPYLATIDGVLFSKPDKRLVCYPMGLSAEHYAVPEGILTIGASAFDRDLCIESIHLPGTLVCIEREAFYGCEGLKVMNLPASVTTIGEEAMVCSNLELTIEGEGVQLAMAEGSGEA